MNAASTGAGGPASDRHAGSPPARPHLERTRLLKAVLLGLALGLLLARWSRSASS